MADLSTTHWRRGYDLPPDLQDRVKAWHRTAPLLTISYAILDHAAILFLGAIGLWTVGHLQWWIALVLHVPLWLAIARFQRGLENLVHEGSHYNWVRSRHRLNDLVVDLFAGLPTFTKVSNYRRSHNRHHNLFGSDHDTDLQRYRRLGIEALDREEVRGFLRGLTVRILPYMGGWWRSALGSDRPTILGALLWHGTLLILPLVLLLGPLTGAASWLAYWLGPFLLVLPWHRFVAEAAKHQYSGQGDVFGATLSNVGLVHRLWLHPHNDGYHLLHHLYPGIPHHRLGRAHRGLLREDPVGYGQFRHRLRVLEEPPSEAPEEQKRAVGGYS